MSVAVWIAVAVLGSIGAIARFLIDGVISSHAGGALPLGTLTINASGSLMLGLLTGLALSGSVLVLAGGAALGSYTTFSTWMFETHRLGEDGQFSRGLLNVSFSIAIGVGGAALGRTIGAAL